MPSRELFVDTSAWLPLVLRRHPEHDELSSALKRAVANGVRVVTTNLVLAETYALLRYRGHGPAALAFLKTVRATPNVVVSSSPELEERAIGDWLERFHDQDFSLTDAVSFAVMRERRIGRALALDQHFAIAGYQVAPSRK